jgi:hypothetical protein
MVLIERGSTSQLDERLTARNGQDAFEVVAVCRRRGLV